MESARPGRMPPSPPPPAVTVRGQYGKKCAHICIYCRKTSLIGRVMGVLTVVDPTSDLYHTYLYDLYTTFIFINHLLTDLL